MNFKQHQDGTIEVTFKPDELLTLVRVVKSAEESRLKDLKDSSKETAKILAKAEAESLTPTNP